MGHQRGDQVKPISFPEANCVYGENQGEYLPLLTLVVPTDVEGVNVITSCWQLSWKERLQALFRGRVFAHVIGEAPQPLKLTTNVEIDA